MVTTALEIPGTPIRAHDHCMWPWKVTEYLKHGGLTKGGCLQYSPWEMVMHAGVEFSGGTAVWGSPVLYKEANGLIHSPSLTRTELFLWSVGDWSIVNRCSLPSLM